MKSNYRKIGDFIELIDERNIGNKIELLLGLSISKEFIPSVANTVGTNMSNYKIIRKNQFACSLMQVRRDKKMPVALLRKYDEAIISQAYPVFQIKDTSILLPAYFMMWMSRSEFDRHTCFLAVGGVRGSLEWEDFLDMELPIPSIEKQREMVKEYNTIVNRISLNEELNQRLEETAQALYKHWFVDFEFPNEDGKPYKSSGGEMVYNEKLQKETPQHWNISTVGQLALQRSEGFKVSNQFDSIIYMGLEHMPKNSIALNQWEEVASIGSNKSCFYRGDILFGKIRPYLHKVGIAFLDGVSSTDIIVIQPKVKSYYGVLTMILSSNDFVAHTVSGSSGTKMPRASWSYMTDYNIVIPKDDLMEKYNNIFLKILNRIELNSFFHQELEVLRILILSKMASIEFNDEKKIA